MQTNELESLLRVLRGDARAVAARILAHETAPLSEDEERFLSAHRSQLDLPLRARWLARSSINAEQRPQGIRLSQLVEEFAERCPRDAELVVWHLLREKVDAEVFAALTEQLHGRIATKAWHLLLGKVQGCHSFQNYVQAELNAYAKTTPPEPQGAERSRVQPVSNDQIPSLGFQLLSVRYDPKACKQTVLRWIAAHFQQAPQRTILVYLSDPALRTPALDQNFRSVLSQLRMPMQALLHEQAPWLLDTEELSKQAQAQATEPSFSWVASPEEEQWWCNKAPASMVPAVLDRLQHTQSMKELQVLLAFAQCAGTPRKKLFSLTLARGVGADESEGLSSAALAWCAEQLLTRSAWEEHGAELFRALLLRWPWDLLGRSVAVVLRASAKTQGIHTPDAEAVAARNAPPSWMGSAHEAIARVCIEETKSALDAEDSQRAHELLCTLIQLHAPSRLVPLLLRLREHPQCKGSVAEVTGLAIELFRRSDASSAELQGLLGALRDWPLPPRNRPWDPQGSPFNDEHTVASNEQEPEAAGL